MNSCPARFPAPVVTRAPTSRHLARAHWLAVIAVAAAGAGVGASVSAQSVPTEVITGGQFTLGAGIVYAPRYEGADEYKARALPLIDYRNGRFFAGVRSGIGYNFSPSAEFEFGPVLTYHFGRDEDDSDRLRGLGDIEGGMDLGVYGRWNLQPFFLSATVKRGISGDAKGTSLRVGAGYATLLSDADRLVFDVSADWADADIMQAYYGITAAQSARSGYASYTADAGIRRYGIGAAWTHSFTPQWFSAIGVAAYRLGSQAADSPIVERRTVPIVTLGLGYRF